MKIIYYIIMGLFCLTLSNNSIAQQTYVNKEWANTTGTVGTINRTVSDVDNNKNVIVVSNTVISPNNTDVLITKYDSHGELLWQHTFDGAGNGNDYGVQVKIGSDNAIYIAAALQGTTSIDFGVLKYNSNGTLAWSNTWNNTVDGIDVPADIEVDGNGNVYLVGGSQSSSIFSDYAIVKYNSSGTFQWDATYDHASLHDAATSLKVDVNTVIVTGASASSPTNWDYATLQINAANGVINNVQRTTVSGVGLDNALAVTTDDDNNIFVTGYVEIAGNRNIQTVKINGDFGLEWVRNFDGGLEDVARSIGVDDFGNVYITGHTEKPNGGSDYITIKYDASGTEQWSKEYGSAGGTNIAEAKQLDITADGDVIITGSVDKEGVKSFITVKYDSDGKVKFSKDYDAGSGDNTAESIIVKDNDIFVSGTSTVDGVKQSSTVKYSTKEKPFEISYDSDGNQHVANELIVRFDKTAIIYDAIYDKEFTAGELSDFVKSEVWTEMAQTLGFSCKGAKTYKIFMRMTPDNSTSITRLGDEIPLDDYWATFSIFFDETANIQTIIDSLETMYPTIHYVERNYVGELFEIPNDDLYDDEQIGLQDENAGINVEDAWDIQTGRTHTKVGIFDSGINWDHEDYGNGTQAGSKIAGGWDFFLDENIFNSANHDPNGHGSSCAGIIGALRNNEIGVAGIAGGNNDIENTGAQLFSLKINNGSSFVQASVISSAIIEGAVESGNFGYGLHIQNHSWGGPHSTTLRNAVNTCFENSCQMVVASGNFPANNCATIDCENYPGSYQDNWVMRVGANGLNGQATNFSVHGDFLDVIAPGIGLLYATTDSDTNNGYTYNEDGTSFAAPHVAGVCALLHSEHNTVNGYPNNLAPEDYEYFLENFSTNIGADGFDVANGWGRVNANDALNALRLPEHFVNHSGGQTTPLETVAASQTIILGNNINGIAAGAYIADRHQVTFTFIDIFDTDQAVIDQWKRYSSSVGFSAANPVSGATWYSWVPTINQNVASVTTTTFCWWIITNTGGTTINQWIPAAPSQLRTAYSLYIEDSSPIGIEEVDNNNTVNIYPNPSNGQISIEYSLPQLTVAELELIDATGRVVATHMIEEQIGSQIVNVNISHLSNGIYTCIIKAESTIITKKIVKQ